MSQQPNLNLNHCQVNEIIQQQQPQQRIINNSSHNQIIKNSRNKVINSTQNVTNNTKNELASLLNNINWPNDQLIANLNQTINSLNSLNSLNSMNSLNNEPYDQFNLTNSLINNRMRINSIDNSNVDLIGSIGNLKTNSILNSLLDLTASPTNNRRTVNDSSSINRINSSSSSHSNNISINNLNSISNLSLDNLNNLNSLNNMNSNLINSTNSPIYTANQNSNLHSNNRLIANQSSKPRSSVQSRPSNSSILNNRKLIASHTVTSTPSSNNISMNRATFNSGQNNNRTIGNKSQTVFVCSVCGLDQPSIDELDRHERIHQLSHYTTDQQQFLRSNDNVDLRNLLMNTADYTISRINNNNGLQRKSVSKPVIKQSQQPNQPQQQKSKQLFIPIDKVKNEEPKKTVTNIMNDNKKSDSGYHCTKCQARFDAQSLAKFHEHIFCCAAKPSAPTAVSNRNDGMISKKIIPPRKPGRPPNRPQQSSMIMHNKNVKPSTQFDIEINVPIDEIIETVNCKQIQSSTTTFTPSSNQSEIKANKRKLDSSSTSLLITVDPNEIKKLKSTEESVSLLQTAEPQKLEKSIEKPVDKTVDEPIAKESTAIQIDEPYTCKGCNRKFKKFRKCQKHKKRCMKFKPQSARKNCISRELLERIRSMRKPVPKPVPIVADRQTRSSNSSTIQSIINKTDDSTIEQQNQDDSKESTKSDDQPRRDSIPKILIKLNDTSSGKQSKSISLIKKKVVAEQENINKNNLDSKPKIEMDTNRSLLIKSSGSSLLVKQSITNLSEQRSKSLIETKKQNLDNLRRRSTRISRKYSEMSKQKSEDKMANNKRALAKLKKNSKLQENQNSYKSSSKGDLSMVIRTVEKSDRKQLQAVISPQKIRDTSHVVTALRSVQKCMKCKQTFSEFANYEKHLIKCGDGRVQLKKPQKSQKLRNLKKSEKPQSLLSDSIDRNQMNSTSNLNSTMSTVESVSNQSTGSLLMNVSMNKIKIVQQKKNRNGGVSMLSQQTPKSIIKLNSSINQSSDSKDGQSISTPSAHESSTDSKGSLISVMKSRFISLLKK